MPLYVDRQKRLLPPGVYDSGLAIQNATGYNRRLASGSYQGWSAQLVTDAVEKKVGSRGLITLRTDEPGIHGGHAERLIVRLTDSLQGTTVDVNQLAAISSGLRIFTSNDNRVDRLAELIGRGRDRDYRIARMAGEALTDAGHGTLATNLPTLVVKRAA